MAQSLTVPILNKDGSDERHLFQRTTHLQPMLSKLSKLQSEKTGMPLHSNRDSQFMTSVWQRKNSHIVQPQTQNADLLAVQSAKILKE